MAELSAELFAQRVCDVNLLDELQIDAIWSELGTREASGRAFQTLAVRRELLTNFQVEKLRRGDRSGYFYGDYRILYLVGTGTYARVFRAVHRETGEVVAVSPDTLTDADGRPFYRVRIATKRDHFLRGAVRYDLFPGMEVSTSIHTGERTVMEYLLDPFLNARGEALRER